MAPPAIPPVDRTSLASTEKSPGTIAFAKTLSHIPWSEDYEKMISGMMYDPQEPGLCESRFNARRLMHKYNNHFPDDATFDSLTEDRAAILQQLFGKCGKGAFIEPPLQVDYGCNIHIGAGFYANFGVTILDCGIVYIGDRVAFGPGVSLYGAGHDTSVASRRSGEEYAKTIVINDDCWIGGNTTIMPGVTIGKGCTIGAGSVVTKSIPEFSVALGAPARVVKKVDPVEDLPAES